MSTQFDHFVANDQINNIVDIIKINDQLTFILPQKSDAKSDANVLNLWYINTPKTNQNISKKAKNAPF